MLILTSINIIKAASGSEGEALQRCEEGALLVKLAKAAHAAVMTALVASLSVQGICAQTLASGAVVAPPKLAEEVFKNIQSLKGTPADQLIPAMQFISASLGVECGFCHVHGKMDVDDKKEKKTAREMIAMTNAINTGHFKGHREITCNSCHNGAEHPKGTPPVAQTDVVREHGDHPMAAPPPAAAQNAGDVLDKYVAALGGEEAIQKVISRVQKGALLADGHEMPIEVVSKAPYRRVSVSHTPSGDNITAFDGVTGWMGSPGRPPRDMSVAEADAAKQDADLHFALHLKESFQQLRVGRLRENRRHFMCNNRRPPSGTTSGPTLVRREDGPTGSNCPLH